MNLTPTTVANAGLMMAGPLGLQWPGDRDEILVAINMAREEIFNQFGNYKLFDAIPRCFCLEKFCYRCDNSECGPDAWWGFTLPYDMVSISSAWFDSTPMRLNSRWRESVIGLNPKPEAEAQLVMQAPQFVLESDMVTASRLRFVTYNWNDSNVYVHVKGLDSKFRDVESFVKLGEDSVTTKEVFTSITSIAFTSPRMGPISLFAGDLNLAVYSAAEMVPSRTRYKVSNVTCTPCDEIKVLVHGVKRFTDVYFDSEIVEVGSRLFLDAIARWYRYRVSREKKELEIGKIGYVEALQQLNGILERHKGRSTQDNRILKSPYARSVRKSVSLSKYSRKAF